MRIIKLYLRRVPNMDFIIYYETSEGQILTALNVWERLCIGDMALNGYSVMAINYNGFIYPVVAYQNCPLLRTNIPKEIFKEEEFTPTIAENTNQINNYFSQLVSQGSIPVYEYGEMFRAFPEEIEIAYSLEKDIPPEQVEQTYKEITSNCPDKAIEEYYAQTTQPTSLTPDKKPEQQIEADIWKEEDIKGKVNAEDDDIKIFEYDRSAPCLEIPRDAKPCIQEFYAIMTHLFETQGVPFNVDKVKADYDNLCNNITRLEEENKFLFDIDYDVDYSGRTPNDNHYLVLLSKYLYGVDYKIFLNDFTTSKGNISCDKDRRKELITALTSTLEDERKIDGAVDKYTTAVKFLQNAHDILADSYLKSSINGLAFCKYSSSATQSKTSDNIYFVHPGAELGNTFRLSANGYPIQNYPAEVKERIEGEDGWNIGAIDITAQDAVIIVNGILENQELKNEMFKEASPYKAICTHAGYEFTPELKEKVKTPTLSLMNGKAEANVYAEVGEDYVRLARTIIELIKADPGYQKHAARCTAVSKLAVPYRWGLFGSTIVIPDLDKIRKAKQWYKIKNKLLNGPLQITALEILSMSITALYLDLMNDTCAIKGVNWSNFRILCTVHDELIVTFKDEVKDKAEAVLRWYLLPKVQGWARFAGKVTLGEHYLAKE